MTPRSGGVGAVAGNAGQPHRILLDHPVPDRVWQGITARIVPKCCMSLKRPFWNWLRLTAAVCSIAVLVLLGLLYNRDDARYRATLPTADAQPALKVEAHEDYLQVEPLTLAAVDADRSLELWAIPADEPISLGVIPAGGKGKVGVGGGAAGVDRATDCVGGESGTEGRFTDRAADWAGFVSRGFGGSLIA